MEGDGDPARDFLYDRRQRCREVQRLVEEQQETDQVQLLRSLRTSEEAFVRFCNMTDRNVELFWIDYRGQAFSFGTLPAGEYVDMDTYVTHPWIFVDAVNTDRYVVKQKDVFFPEASRKSPRVSRTPVFIQEPIWTLQELALRVILGRLKDPSQVWELEIPRVLQCELDLRLRMLIIEPFLRILS